jgi:hypothetical protein
MEKILLERYNISWTPKKIKGKYLQKSMHCIKKLRKNLARKMVLI